MKITKRQLLQLIQEVGPFQMSRKAEESNNIMMMTSVVMTGMETQAGETLDEDEEYEYGQEVRSIFENNMHVTTALVDIFMDIRMGGDRIPKPESMSPEDVEEEEV